MARKSPTQILHGLIGPPMLIGGLEVLGPNEGRLLDALSVRVRRGLIDFSITWGAEPLTREERAVVAIEALDAPARDRRRDQSPRTRRPSMSVADFVAAL